MERFWQTQEWLNYLLNSKHGMVYIDRSFFIHEKFIPLVQEGQEFFSPGFYDDKKILQHVKELAQQHNVKRIQVNSQIKSYLNISGYTCVVDLNNIQPSKGHKSAIKAGQKYLKYEIVTETNQFMQDYFEIAGKATRPQKTFEILQDWIQKEYGTLLKATYKNDVAGYVYLLHYKNQAYYFMGCTFPWYKQYNVAHYLQSVAFDILRQKSVKYLEMGDQPQNSLYNCPTEKEKNIALFKRSFGGQIVNNLMSEYFFNKDYMHKIYAERLNNYIENEYKI